MSNTIIIIAGIIVGAAVGAGIFWFVLSRKKTEEPEKDQSFLMMQQQLSQLTETLDKKMGEFQKQVSETNKDMRGVVQNQFSESQKLVQEINKQMTAQLVDVTKGVTEVTESTKQIFNVADQLQNLEKVLKHQKQRGNLGEASLQLSLSNILPPDAYQMQYLFSDGAQVDAVIKTKEGMIPVDAKFSLDNYNRIINEEDKDKRDVFEKEFKNDLKKRIDETSKYIRPKEGTLPFAFMYIPAEGIYYDLLVNEIGSTKVNTRSLIDYAYSTKNVIIVSPTTFSAYLQSVLYGFKALKIEESAKDIRKNVGLLGRHLAAYDEYFKKLGKSLGTTVNHYNSAEKELGKVDKDVMKIAGESPEIEKLELERPKLED
ncbi:MAG: DNA recombination protein RmuC [Candidatus Pacebacteria bacterium]|nr:DNA recombination protein RmuC [Candidatus Paceibacterota bacterium]